MGLSFSLDLQMDQISAAAAGIRELTGNLRPMLEDIGMEGETSTMERFETNLAPDGTPWTPSLRATLTGTPTLVDRGHFRDGIHYQVDGDDAVEWGSNAVQARIHQEGGTIVAKGDGLAFTLASGAFALVKSVTIPARPYLGLSDADQVAIGEIAETHLKLALGGAA